MVILDNFCNMMILLSITDCQSGSATWKEAKSFAHCE